MMIKKKWYKRKWVLVVAILIGIFILIGATNSNSSKQANTPNLGDSAAKSAPHFADYLNKPMAEVAAEFGQTYDVANSTQIHAEKDSYKLYFEDGGRITGTTKVNTGKVNIAYVELPQMGTCAQSEVFNKIDAAMQLTGLDPATKGAKYTGMGEGYGAYRDYKGDKTLELALLCDYNGDNYKLQLMVLPANR